MRSTSTNPFLDDYQAPAEFMVPSTGRIGSPPKDLAALRQPALIATTAELLVRETCKNLNELVALRNKGLHPSNIILVILRTCILTPRNDRMA